MIDDNAVHLFIHTYSYHFRIQSIFLIISSFIYIVIEHLLLSLTVIRSTLGNSMSHECCFPTNAIYFYFISDYPSCSLYEVSFLIILLSLLSVQSIIGILLS